MGALHAGHLSLVRASRKECNFTAVSIFVNPIQFGVSEDYSRYPKTLKHDIELLRNEKVDLLFCPSNKEMYPIGFSTYVEERILSTPLCGKWRLGHFKGVCTAVTKLFNIIQPDTAYFGQKDFQQAAIIKHIGGDLNFPINIKVMPTIRQKNGLALSSRNAYLSEKERIDAAVLYHALLNAKMLIKKGERRSRKIITAILKEIRPKTDNIDYVQIVDTVYLSEQKIIKGDVLIALAAYIGKTRLIDNIIVRI